jgi:hypothetical protein
MGGGEYVHACRGSSWRRLPVCSEMDRLGDAQAGTARAGVFGGADESRPMAFPSGFDAGRTVGLSR